MRARSLQARAVVAAVLAVALALLVAGGAVDVLVARHLRGSLDRSLRQRAVAVAQLSASAPALLTAPGALDASIGGTQVAVEVLDARGRIVARSLSLGSRLLPVGPPVRAAIRDGRSRYATVELGSDQLRLYAAPLAQVGGPAAGGAVVVAAPTDDLESTVRSLRVVTLLSALLAAVLGGGAVALLTRRALRPLARLATAAGAIERSGDPRSRLPDSGGGDEVARLAATLNGMLASLERARESERRFLADASHELRTPLTALRGNVAYLARHGATPELVTELAHDAARLSRLADDLLTLSREEAAQRPSDEVRLDELARAGAEGHPSVAVEAPEAVRVRGDREALARALANLVENAERHGPPDGRIAVTVAQEGDVARIEVTDAGPGLTPEDAEQAFARFWRGPAASPGAGSGLGLAIVRTTAERHGGRATVAGSSFTIELPALTPLSETGATTQDESHRKDSP
jgi:two-component system OmpR family sensor kinase